MPMSASMLRTGQASPRWAAAGQRHPIAVVKGRGAASSARARRAAFLQAHGHSRSETASIVGVRPETISVWKRHPQWQLEVDRWRACRGATRQDAATPPARGGRGDDRGARARMADHGQRNQARPDAHRRQGGARLGDATEGLPARPDEGLRGDPTVSCRRAPGPARPAHASDRALIRSLSQITAPTVSHSQQACPPNSKATRPGAGSPAACAAINEARPSLPPRPSLGSVTECARTQTPSQIRKPPTGPENASTECDAKARLTPMSPADHPTRNVETLSDAGRTPNCAPTPNPRNVET